MTLRALADVRRTGDDGRLLLPPYAGINQYAETALGNRNYFLNKPHSIGGMKDYIP